MAAVISKHHNAIFNFCLNVVLLQC